MDCVFSMNPRLCADILAHQSRVLVLKDVTVKHEWVPAWRRLIEDDQKFCAIFDENDVLPAHKMSWRSRVVDRKDTE